jgi:hypothetical protein
MLFAVVVLGIGIGFSLMFVYGVLFAAVRRTTRHAESMATYSGLVGIGLFIVGEVLWYATDKNFAVTVTLTASLFCLNILAVIWSRKLYRLQTQRQKQKQKQPV